MPPKFALSHRCSVLQWRLRELRNGWIWRRCSSKLRLKVVFKRKFRTFPRKTDNLKHKSEIWDEITEHLRQKLSQNHPNAWAFLKASETRFVTRAASCPGCQDGWNSDGFDAAAPESWGCNNTGPVLSSVQLRKLLEPCCCLKSRNDGGLIQLNR